MSEPQRYTQLTVCVEPSYQEQEIISPMARTVSGGEWVKWADYARLAAEVESVRQVAQDNKTETESTRIENARLKAEVERLRSLSANSEWQPIETAPKDGQEILAYRHPHGVFLMPGYWGNDMYQMTHWMPMPKPPAAKDGKPSVWQPIETAPKDGTAILIYCQVSGAMEAHWCCEWLDRHNDICDVYEVTHWTQIIPPTKDNG